jgi:hypothetical protein
MKTKENSELNKIELQNIATAPFVERPELQASIKLCGLWIGRTKMGQLFLSGSAGKNLRVVLFKVKEKRSDDSPDFTVNVAGIQPDTKLINVGFVRANRSFETKELYFDGYIFGVGFVIRKNQAKADDSHPDYFGYLKENIYEKNDVDLQGEIESAFN